MTVDDNILVWCGPEDNDTCVVVFDELYHDMEPSGRRVFGPFKDGEEATTFIACGPHGLEDFVEYASYELLRPPHCPTK